MPVNFQVFNTSSKRRVIGHYIAANSLLVSQILSELKNVNYDDPEQKIHSFIQHKIQFENL